MIGKNCSISSGEFGYEVFPFTVASMRMEQGCVGVTILKPTNARPTSGNGTLQGRKGQTMWREFIF